jgi:hypothetical protein
MPSIITSVKFGFPPRIVMLQYPPTAPLRFTFNNALVEIRSATLSDTLCRGVSTPNSVIEAGAVETGNG